MLQTRTSSPGGTSLLLWLLGPNMSQHVTAFGQGLWRGVVSRLSPMGCASGAVAADKVGSGKPIWTGCCPICGEFQLDVLELDSQTDSLPACLPPCLAASCWEMRVCCVPLLVVEDYWLLPRANQQPIALHGLWLIPD
jgi:hypothetical protein